MLSSFFRRIGRPFRAMKPGRLIVLVFLGMILLGAGLLCLPAASRSGQPTDFLTSLFTATSATCVTGLIRVDTGTHWSMFGQAVILILIQVGGLGFMTIACLFFFALRRKIGLRQRMVIAQALGSDSYSGLVSLVRNILRGTAAVEGAGALILFFRFLPEFGFGRALWYGVFHSVSAFCNAGFDVLADVDVGGSLCRYVSDPVVNLTIMALIVIGGLGFAVWGDIRHNRRFSRMQVYTRLVILITLVLIFGGAGIIAALEWNNPGTIGGMTVPQKLLAVLFQSVTLRTAGFASFDQNALRDVTKAFCDMLMLVGGSSGSTAGGVKTVTVGVILLATWSTARGRSDVRVMRRTIPQRAVSSALALFILVLAISMFGALFLCVTDGVSLENAVYETISALCTVGLTTGITPALSAASQIVLIVLMFFGRLGIMTISVGFMAADPAEDRVKYAETKIMIG